MFSNIVKPMCYTLTRNEKVHSGMDDTDLSGLVYGSLFEPTTSEGMRIS